MLSALSGLARGFAIPLLLLIAGYLALPHAQTLSPDLHHLLRLLPYACAGLAAALALLFNQGRALLIALLLGLAYWSLQDGLAAAPHNALRADLGYAAAAVLLPLNLGLLGLLRERGALGGHTLWRAGLLAAQVTLVALFIAAGHKGLLELLNSQFLHLPPTRLPDLALLAYLAAAALFAWRAWRQRAPLEAGLLVILLAVAGAYARAPVPAAAATLLSAAGLILAASLVLHSYRIAYRDELTGLPGRRALNERLNGLGRRYTVAMVDVDHFKKFNDTHGHDVGDQVLKMVAARLRAVNGGGKAYRYGGEEFTILFPGRDQDHALPHLEQVRKAVEGYRMVLRGKDRPAARRGGKRKRGSGSREKSVSVTVSIGVAEPGASGQTPEAVIKAADQALYRAKKGGRNQVAK